MADITSQLGLNETLLFLSALFAGCTSLSIGHFAFGRFTSIWLGLLVWAVLIALVFLPSVLISAYAECNFREYITLIGIFCGVVFYKVWAAYLSRENHAH